MTRSFRVVLLAAFASSLFGCDAVTDRDQPPMGSISPPGAKKLEDDFTKVKTKGKKKKSTPAQ